MLRLEDFRIEIKLNNKNSMVAQVQLNIEPLRIFGYRIMKSEFGDGLFVQPPSVRAGSNYLWISRIDNPELWESLQAKIKSEYFLELEKFNLNTMKSKTESNNDSIINPEEIPF